MSTRLVIEHGAIVTRQQTLADGTVVVENGRFAAVAPNKPASLGKNDHFIDATGLTLVPGLIDLQLNGGFGHDFTADPSSIWTVAEQLPQFGVTAFLPTIITSPLSTIRRAQRAVTQERPFPFLGATPLGLHLEGPFLNPTKKGAHNPAHIQRPQLEAIADWSVENGVRLVTLAPEMAGALPLVEQLAPQGVVVSAGHSAATAIAAQAGFEAGIRYATHLFNAMSPLHHREPGLPAAALADARVVVGLIPDGIHVAPLLVRLVWQLLGNGRLNLVTDSMAAMGMPPGNYKLGDHDVCVDAHSARLADGTLAGAIITLDQAVRRFIEMVGCSLAEAIATVTAVPARLLGIDNHKGDIATGYDADFVLLTPELQVAATFINGNLCYANPLYFHAPRE